jgi:inorganic pyrophosphatase
MKDDYWAFLDQLISDCQVIIDRPKGSHHPRYPQVVYPVDYGYLEGTTSSDGHGIDVYRGSHAGSGISAVLVTVDMYKQDAEIKVILDCLEDEIQMAFNLSNESSMRALLIRRPSGDSE